MWLDIKEIIRKDPGFNFFDLPVNSHVGAIVFLKDDAIKLSETIISKYRPGVSRAEWKNGHWRLISDEENIDLYGNFLNFGSNIFICDIELSVLFFVDYIDELVVCLFSNKLETARIEKFINVELDYLKVERTFNDLIDQSRDNRSLEMFRLMKEGFLAWRRNNS